VAGAAACQIARCVEAAGLRLARSTAGVVEAALDGTHIGLNCGIKRQSFNSLREELHMLILLIIVLLLVVGGGGGYYFGNEGYDYRYGGGGIGLVVLVVLVLYLFRVIRF
jgi:hypothetical protein